MYDNYPLDKISLQNIPMRIANYPEIFQNKINGLFHIFEYIRAYIYDLLMLTKGGWKYHVHNLESTLNKLKEKGLKCNI